MEVATDELYAISCIEKIPYTRGLDENHVEELIRSFCKTGTVNKQIWFVFWGCKYSREAAEHRWNRSLRDLAAGSIGVGPMAGQHSITAIFRCRKRYPKNPNWARVTIIPVMCDDTNESRKQIECWGLRSNYVSGTFLSPRFKDTALAMRRSFEDLLRRSGTSALPSDVSTALCQQFSNHGNITLEYGRQIWALVRRGPEAWSKIACLLEGRVTNTSKTKFKEIKSPALFQAMVTLDDATVTTLLENVIQGKWDRKLFLSQCKFYKCQLDLKKQILDWMVTAGHFNVRGSWEDLCIKYPKGDLNALVDTWSNALKDSKMADRKILPTNLAEALDQIVSNNLRVLCNRSSILLCIHMCDFEMYGGYCSLKGTEAGKNGRSTPCSSRCITRTCSPWHRWSRAASTVCGVSEVT